MMDDRKLASAQQAFVLIQGLQETGERFITSNGLAQLN